MILNGVNLDELSLDIKVNKERPVHPGRVLQIDGDFVAYFVSYAEDVTPEDMKRNADVIIEYLKRAAGAETVSVHVTPRTSNKGNRESIALLKEYQANRDGREKPTNLEDIRKYLIERYNGVLNNDCEADDTIAMAQHAALSAGKPDLSVVVSKDKDLNIVQGWHLDWDTQDMYWVTELGSLSRGCTKSGKPKISGTGWLFFCAQMLMGDKADNISGVPKLLVDGKFKLCGQITAYEYLRSCKTRSEALDKVLRAYKEYGSGIGFKSYSGESISAADAFMSEAKLLWMRRFPDENDVVSVIKEVRSETH